ncbi:hypothetical protein HGRIS_006721 [Hohenbuehelia grisea]|uniref:NADP-dependent oxidoreductase domain-containing protein n=1 Tax=Hohenbuehelia grisea TaxID=104357 RepID=A0ABR3JAE7_9AGAR
MSVTLNNGVQIPLIGLGTWAGLDPKDQAAAQAWILSALKSGYRHIDTAQMYSTEKYVGNAIRDSGVPREEIFVTTKLPWNHTHRVKESLDESLANLGLDYVDLFLLHWPQAVFYDASNPFPKNEDGSIRTIDHQFNETWAEMEKLLGTGKVRAIGVSNFSVKTLEQLLKTSKVVPAVNQVELHPYLAQNDLIAYCKSKGIAVTAYAATGNGISSLSIHGCLPCTIQDIQPFAKTP